MEKIANATWPKMALRHFVLALATKNRKMIKNVVPMFVQKLSFPSQNKTCLVDFMVLELTLTSGQLFTEHLSRNVTQLYLLGASNFQHGIQMVFK